jgi:hypothetical protein
MAASMRALSLVIVLGACGAPARQTQTPGTPRSWQAPNHHFDRTIDQWTSADEDEGIRLACQNMVGPDGAFRCEELAKGGLDAAHCTESMGTFRASATDDRQRKAFRLIVAGLGISQSCTDVESTFRIAMVALHEGATGACKTRDDGAFVLTQEGALQRRGMSDRSFTDTQSTLDTPIQVCGVGGELAWLTRMTCADGSRPWGKDVDKAHAARLGSKASAGRCPETALMIDHYVAPCPEKSYDVYMDMYECGPDEPML